MSWALLATTDEHGDGDGRREEEAVRVTGTVVRMGSGEEALEVIFALREVGFAFSFYSLILCRFFFKIFRSSH
jgi:hypothetical protein